MFDSPQFVFFFGARSVLRISISLDAGTAKKFPLSSNFFVYIKITLFRQGKRAHFCYFLSF